jgi:hypothetical protein
VGASAYESQKLDFDMKLGVAKLSTYEIINDAELPKEWYSCKSNSDCDLVQRDCGESFAFNKAYSDEAMAAIEKFCQQHESPICPIKACAASRRPANIAACDHGQCKPIY